MLRRVRIVSVAPDFIMVEHQETGSAPATPVGSTMSADSMALRGVPPSSAVELPLFLAQGASVERPIGARNPLEAPWSDGRFIEEGV